MNESIKAKLFVYGTLKSGFSNNRILTQFGGTFKVRDSICGYAMWDMGTFPALIECVAKASTVWGEVWDVNQQVLDACDILEGVDNGFYKRVVVTTSGKHEVFVYTREIGKLKFYPRVQGGSWEQNRSHQTINQFTDSWPHDETIAPWVPYNQRPDPGKSVAPYTPYVPPPAKPIRKHMPAGDAMWGLRWRVTKKVAP